MNSLTVCAFSTSARQGLLAPCQPSAIRCREKKNVSIFATASPTDSEVVVVNTAIPVSRISVCTGELCQCQGEQYEFSGGAASAVIEELQNIGLPFPVDEVGCMGACGMGTMVAIDYENGDSIMTDGLESTLVELGIQLKQTPSTPYSANTVERANNGDKAAEVATSNSYNRIDTKAEPEKPRLLADVRDRMRTEAASELENPWMNMASYLAKKAMDKIRGAG